MRKSTAAVLLVLLSAVWSFSSSAQTAGAGPTVEQSDSKDRYTPPTAEELGPMRSEYSAELSKIHEPPEMAKKPMQVRKPAPSAVIKVMNVMSALGSPEKASHSQRADAINKMLELAKHRELDDSIGRMTLYGALA